MSFCNFWEEKGLKHLFGIAAYSPPATVYVGVCTGVAEDGTITSEPSGNGYARQPVTNDGTGWDFSQVSGVTKVVNHAAIQFPQAEGDWGTLTFAFISTAATGGDILAFGEFNLPKPIGLQDTLKFDPGGLGFALN